MPIVGPVNRSVLLCLLAVACSPAPPSACVPGESRACVCAGGAPGGQVCDATGSALGPCMCGTDAGDLDVGPDLDASLDAWTPTASDSDLVDSPVDSPQDAGLDALACSTDDDCRTGRTFCDGEWTCSDGHCLGVPPDCDDGNACTIDTCTDDADAGDADGGGGACAHAVAPGCSPPPDAGPCEPFDAARDYAGTFALSPIPSTGCGSVAPSYRVAAVTFARGTMLAAAAAPGLDGVPFSMTGALPGGASFDVTFDDGCFRGRLSGAFVCANRFEATFAGDYSGACSACSGGAPFAVIGTR